MYCGTRLLVNNRLKASIVTERDPISAPLYLRDTRSEDPTLLGRRLLRYTYRYECSDGRRSFSEGRAEQSQMVDSPKQERPANVLGLILDHIERQGAIS